METRINIEKLVEDIKRLEDKSTPTEKEKLLKIGYTQWTVEQRKRCWALPDREHEITKLYSLRAHIRGKLHMTRINAGTLYWVTGRDFWQWYSKDRWYGEATHEGFQRRCEVSRFMFDWEMEDQEKLIEDILETYKE